MPKKHPIAVWAAMLGGMICWVALFTLLYGGVSLICTHPASLENLRILQIAAILVAAILSIAAGIMLLRRRAMVLPDHFTPLLDAFVVRTAIGLAIMGAISSAWLVVAALMFSDCKT